MGTTDEPLVYGWEIVKFGLVYDGAKNLSFLSPDDEETYEVGEEITLVNKTEGFTKNDVVVKLTTVKLQQYAFQRTINGVLQVDEEGHPIYRRDSADNIIIAQTQVDSILNTILDPEEYTVNIQEV